MSSEPLELSHTAPGSVGEVLWSWEVAEHNLFARPYTPTDERYLALPSPSTSYDTLLGHLRTYKRV
eukprot:6251091-Prymnesium_polylepis.1